MLASFRAEGARYRDELHADRRTRAERAEREADAYRDELVQLRAGPSHDTGTITAVGRAPRRTRPIVTSSWPGPQSRSRRTRRTAFGPCRAALALTHNRSLQPTAELSVAT